MVHICSSACVADESLAQLRKEGITGDGKQTHKEEARDANGLTTTVQLILNI
jgi:hypothetical protein